MVEKYKLKKSMFLVNNIKKKHLNMKNVQFSILFFFHNVYI